MGTTTTKTPAQIARDIAGEQTRGASVTIAELLQVCEAAIEADRRQRDMYILAAEALEDRARGGGARGRGSTGRAPHAGA